MMRFLFGTLLLASIALPTAAFADQKTDCLKGEALLKRELRKKYAQPVKDQLQQALGNIATEITENDWSECVDFVAKAKAVLKK
jgi:hypothetical protein